MNHIKAWYLRKYNLPDIDIFYHPSKNLVITLLQERGYERPVSWLGEILEEVALRTVSYAGVHYGRIEGHIVNPFIVLNTESLYTVFHELTHYRQDLEDRLVHKVLAPYSHDIYWEGKLMQPCSWEERPWEIEAMKMEVEEYKEWQKSLNTQMKSLRESSLSMSQTPAAQLSTA